MFTYSFQKKIYVSSNRVFFFFLQIQNNNKLQKKYTFNYQLQNFYNSHKNCINVIYPAALAIKVIITLYVTYCPELYIFNRTAIKMCTINKFCHKK